MKSGFELQIDAHGRLELCLSEGGRYVGVSAVRAFPISAPQQSVSIVDAEGHERLFIESLAELDPADRSIIESDLAAREFVPEILRIVSVNRYAAPCTFTVDTDRGATSFFLQGEEFIRRMTPKTLLIADRSGIQYLVRDLTALDRQSRRILDRFL